MANFVTGSFLVVLAAISAFGCQKLRLTPCQQLVDEIARQTANAARASANADADADSFRASLVKAAQSVRALRLQDNRLAQLRDRYAKEIEKVVAKVGKDERNRTAMVGVNATTVYVLDEVNLRCAGER